MFSIFGFADVQFNYLIFNGLPIAALSHLMLNILTLTMTLTGVFADWRFLYLVLVTDNWIYICLRRVILTHVYTPLLAADRNGLRAVFHAVTMRTSGLSVTATPQRRPLAAETPSGRSYHGL